MKLYKSLKIQESFEEPVDHTLWEKVTEVCITKVLENMVLQSELPLKGDYRPSLREVDSNLFKFSEVEIV